MRLPLCAAVLAGLMFASVANGAECNHSERVRVIGDQLQIAIPVVALGLSLWDELADSRGANTFRDGSLLPASTYLQSPTSELLFSIAFGQLASEGIKHATAKSRPNGQGLTFPSGHTTGSFTAAEFIRKQYGWGRGLPAYLAAGFVGYSRVVSHRHYVQDVIAGALLGIASNYVSPWHARNGGYYISPFVPNTEGAHAFGITMEIHF